MKLGALRALRAEVQRLDPDLVHIQTPFIAHYQGTALARALRVPVVETYHTYFEEYLHHYVPLMPRAVMRFVARRFTVSQCNVLDALVVPSRAMEQALLDYGVRCPMHIIPTGMEMERFAGGDGQRFREQLGIAPEQPVLVHVGRIAHEKNIEFLFRMFARVVRSKPGAMFIVAGEGPALASCKAYVRSLGIAAARALRRLFVARAGAARLLPRRRSVRLLLAHRDAGPGAARSDGARRPGRLDGAHGNGRHHEPAARRARGPRR